jgi:titin
MYSNKTYEPVPKKKWGASDSSDVIQSNRMRAVGKTANSVGFTSLSHTKGELTNNALQRVRSSGATVPKKVTNQNLRKPEPPYSLYATPGDQSITITYTEGNINGYPLLNYLYSLNGITFTEFVPATVGTIITLVGLTNGTPYTIYLKSKNKIGISVSSEPVTATPFTIPDEPTNLSIVPGDASIEITFVEPFNGGSPITDYEYSLNSGSSWTSSADNSSPIIITGLTNGIVYTIQLRARNLAGPSSSSSQVSVAPIPFNSFNPSDISGVNLWLDAQYSSSVDISNGLVSTWNDQSEENNDFSRYGGTITYAKPSGINNRPAIYFETAGSTYLYKTFNIAPSTNQLSLFMIVYHVSNVTGNSELFYSNTAPTSPGYAYFDLFNNTNSPSGLLSINIGDETQVSTTRDIRASIALIDVIAGTTADVYVNGTQTNNNIARGVLSLDNEITWAISGGAFRGYIGEIITYPSDLSDKDRQRVEGYLAWKWGIQNSLPNNQPYKTAPPISLEAPTITGITGASQSLSVEFTQTIPGGVTITNYLYSTDNGTTFRALTVPDTTSPLTITRLSSNGTTLLTNDVTYSVIIQAKTINGVSPFSNMVQGIPSIPVPSTPTELSSVGGNEAAYILFTQIGTVTNYEYSIDNGVTFLPFNPPQTYSPVMITGLINGTTYTVKLKAVNSDGGISSESASVSVTPTVNSLNTTNLLVELDANNSSSYSGSGTAWTNLRSSGLYSATLLNDPLFNGTNKYFTFDGIDQTADIAAASGINPTVGSSFTVQIWARVNTSSPQFSSGDGLISKQFGDSNDYDGYSLLLSDTGGVTLKMNGGDDNETYPSSNGVYNNGWALYSIVVRFGGGSGSPSYAYVSTRRVVTAANTETSMPSQAPLQFPKGIQEGNSFCPADVGAFYLYNTAVSQEDIIRNYDATKSRYVT